MPDGKTRVAGPVPTLRTDPPPPRLTVTESVYHQRPGREPLVVESRFGRWLNSKGQALTRELEVGPEWVPVARDPDASCGMLLIANEMEQFPQVNPTPEQVAAAESRVVDVAINQSGAVVPVGRIPPGESVRYIPHSVSLIVLRCRSGTATVTVHLIPE